MKFGEIEFFFSTDLMGRGKVSTMQELGKLRMTNVLPCWESGVESSEILFLQVRALASARGSVATRRVATGPRARRARGQRARSLEGPKGPRVAKTCESEGPKGPRTSKAKCPPRRLPVLLYVFHNSAQNREIHGSFSRP